MTASLRLPTLLDRDREAQLGAALARCAAGDRTALRVIYDAEAPRMVGVARRILLRQDLAEEAVHDAFIRIWRGAAGFDPRRGSARGWLYAIVRNRALSIHRDERRYQASDEAPRMSTPSHPVAPAGDQRAAPLPRAARPPPPRRRGAVLCVTA